MTKCNWICCVILTFGETRNKIKRKLTYTKHLQVDIETTESVVTVDWENGFLEASAKSNDNANKVKSAANLIFATSHPILWGVSPPPPLEVGMDKNKCHLYQSFPSISWSLTDFQGTIGSSKNNIQFKSSIASTSTTIIATKSRWQRSRLKYTN